MEPAVAQAVKFTFHALSRDDEAPRPAAARMVPEAEVEAARALAFEEGRAAGRAEAEHGIERALALVLDDVAAGAARLLRDVERETRAARADAAALALAVGRKLGGRVLARAPLEEIEGMLAECLAEHHEEPRLVVRLDEKLIDALRARLDPLVQRANFGGRLILIGEPGFEGADCRIEWPDGGVERRTALIDAAIAELFARFAALSGGTAGIASTSES